MEGDSDVVQNFVSSIVFSFSFGIIFGYILVLGWQSHECPSTWLVGYGQTCLCPYQLRCFF